VAFHDTNEHEEMAEAADHQLDEWEWLVGNVVVVGLVCLVVFDSFDLVDNQHGISSTT